MIAKDLLSLLVCPENRSPVHQAKADLLAQLNDAIAKGSIQNREGQPVTEPLEEALVREDGAILYPVRDGIPVMLIGESIALEAIHEA